ncbi:PoNe immunity protein domain-containing protein [Stenotrophomonas sp. PSU-St83]
MLRDTKKSYDYFSEKIAFQSRSILDFVSGIRAGRYPPEGALKCSGSIFIKLLQVMVMRYSTGDDIGGLSADLDEVLAARVRIRRCADGLPLEGQATRSLWEDLRLDRYVQYLWWLAFTVAVGASRDYLHEMWVLIGNTGKDKLLDSVAVASGGAKRSIPDQLLYRHYLPLMEAIASPSDRPGLVKKFLDGWYAGSRNVYWHGNHRDVDSGYMGYWAFEAALVVMLFDIDDAGFRDHEYYPADLVAHYRRRAGDRT